MSRIRSIHPGLFTDEAFMEASIPARMLIMGLWCEAWDDGVFEIKPLTIKARGSDIHYWGGRPKALAQMGAAANQASALLTVSAALGRDMVALGMAAAFLLAASMSSFKTEIFQFGFAFAQLDVL